MLRKNTHSTQDLDQLDFFNQNPVKNAAIAEPALKPVSSKKPAAHQYQEGHDRLFKTLLRIELQDDGSYKHYDSHRRLFAHTHAPDAPERQEIGHLTCTGRVSHD